MRTPKKLKGYFVAAAVPSESRFADVIDSLHGFRTLADLQAHPEVFAEGDIIIAENHRFRVAPSGATDHDLTLPNGTKLYSAPFLKYVETLPYWAEPPSVGFSATGDGVTDDLSAFNSWFTDNDELILDPRKTYHISAPLDVIQKEIRLCVNGATITCPGGLMTVRQRTSYTAGDYFTTTQDGTTFEIPGGVSIETGDLLTLWSDDVFQATGTYHHGQWCKVTDVTGTTATVTPAFYDAFVVDTIRVVKPINPEIDGVRGGTIDISGATEPATGSGLVGIQLVGETPTLKNLRVIGNQFVGRGAFLEGLTPLASDCYFYGVTNVKGQKDGSGNLTNNIEGYGLELDGDDCLALRCIGENCKHPMTAAQRTHTTRKVTFRECEGISPLGAQAEISDIPIGAPKYQGMDCHGNVRLMRVEDCTTRMVNTHYDCRAARTEIIRPHIISRGADDNFNNNLLINARENPADVYVEDAVVEWETPSGTSDPVWLVGIQPWWAETHIGVEISGAEMNSNVGLMFVPPNSVQATANGFSIGDISITDVSGSIREGVEIIGHSGSAEYASLGNITVSAAAGQDVSISETHLINVNFVQSVGTVTTSGTFDGLTDHSGLISLPPSYGAELIVSAEMDASTGWTAATTGGSAVTPSFNSGAVTMTGDGTNTSYIVQSVAISETGTYRYKYDMGSGTASLRIGTSFLGSQIATFNTSTDGYVLVSLNSGTSYSISARNQTTTPAVLNSLSLRKQI